MPAQNLRGFAEKVALVTDAGNPTGRAVALQLALQGCYVVFGYSNVSEENRRALEEIQTLGTLVNAVEADCSTFAGVKHLVASVQNLYGRLDLLVNTLKFTPESSFDLIDEDAWSQAMDTNLKSVFFAVRESFSLMDARPKPAIVNVASALDTEETAANAAYAAAQTGIAGMTRAFARQLPKKFRVNCVQLSERKSETVTAENFEQMLFKKPDGIAPDDAARAIVYLLSSEAVGINGQVLGVG